MQLPPFGFWCLALCSAVHPSTAALPPSPAAPCAAASPPQTLRILTSWYLSRWSNAEVVARFNGTSVDRLHYIGGYIGFALGEPAGWVRWLGATGLCSGG